MLFAGIYMVGFYQTANKMLSVGDMVLLVALIQQLALPLRNLSYFVDSYQKRLPIARFEGVKLPESLARMPLT